MVYLGVDNENELNYWINRLKFRGIEYEEFREPDIENQITAIASVTESRVFSKLKLL